MTETILAETIRIGDVILPPARELSLWMRRTCAEKGLPESALYLTVREIREANPDKRGRWLIIKTEQTPEWNAPNSGNNDIWCGPGSRSHSFNFKARPTTPWPLIQRGAMQHV